MINGSESRGSNGCSSGTPGAGEGWALYAERLMDELGYFEKPEYRLGLIASQLFRSVRVVLDIGVQLGLTIPADAPLHAGETWDYDQGRRLHRADRLPGPRHRRVRGQALPRAGTGRRSRTRSGSGRSSTSARTPWPDSAPDSIGRTSTDGCWKPVPSGSTTSERRWLDQEVVRPGHRGAQRPIQAPVRPGDPTAHRLDRDPRRGRQLQPGALLLLQCRLQRPADRALLRREPPRPTQGLGDQRRAVRRLHRQHRFRGAGPGHEPDFGQLRP